MDTKFDPKAAFLAGKPYAFLAHDLDPSRAPVRLGSGQTVQAQPAFVDGMMVDVYLLSRMDPILDSDPRPDDYVFETGVIGDGLVPIVLKTPCRVSFVGKSPKDQDASIEHSMKCAVAAYKPMLERLARLTGQEIRFHLDGGDKARSPYPNRKDVLHIVPNSTPTGGETSVEWRHEIFGLNVRDDGTWSPCEHPARGRGHVFKDANGVPVFQLVKNTVYILFPVLSTYHGLTSRTIFERVLELLSVALWKRTHDKLKGKRRIGATAYRKLMGKPIQQSFGIWAREVERIEQEIAHLLDQLAGHHRTLLEFRATRDVVASLDFVPKTMARLGSDHERLASHPMTRRVFIRDEGVHIETKELVMEHEGRRYRMGTYIVRFEPHGRLFIWSPRLLHPKGIPHPHISKRGSACYGSAGEALMKAVGELRFYDAFALLMRWLEEGYTPATASTKIEEWPLVEEEKRHE